MSSTTPDIRNELNHRRISILSAGITLLTGLLILLLWLNHDPAPELMLRVPGMDNGPENGMVMDADAVRVGEYFELYDGSVTDESSGWIQFRGNAGSNISTENISLSTSWGEAGPRQLWSVDLGEGHAGPAVRHGRVYLLDYDEERKGDALRCFSLSSGEELWRRWYRVRVKRNHGFSRTVPAVSEEYVVTLGPLCHVMCVRADSGEFCWGMDLTREYETQVPFWWAGQCPVIDDGVAVIAPAGSVLMMGVACATGEVVWRTPNPHRWQMSHTSVVPAVIGGRKMYVYSAIGGLAGVAADGPERGAILWETTLWSKSVLAPSPVVMEDGRIFLTAGYGAGSMLLRVTRRGDEYEVQKVQEFLPRDGLASEQQTPVVYRDHLFGIQPKDAGVLRDQFVCFHPDDCTSPVWSSGKTHRFGLGPYLVADDKIFILNDDGELTMIEAALSGFRLLAQSRIMDGHDAWAPMAMAGGRLLLRDNRRLVCLDLRALE